MDIKLFPQPNDTLTTKNSLTICGNERVKRTNVFYSRNCGYKPAEKLETCESEFKCITKKNLLLEYENYESSETVVFFNSRLRKISSI